jgi:hypothetical protein
MVKFYPSIPEDIQEWMLKQSMWFVASAPLAGKHVNLSPKGMFPKHFRFAAAILMLFKANHFN